MFLQQSVGYWLLTELQNKGKELLGVQAGSKTLSPNEASVPASWDQNFIAELESDLLGLSCLVKDPTSIPGPRNLQNRARAYSKLDT